MFGETLSRTECFARAAELDLMNLILDSLNRWRGRMRRQKVAPNEEAVTSVYDFSTKQVVGQGQFAKLWSVQKLGSEERFAVKVSTQPPLLREMLCTDRKFAYAEIRRNGQCVR